jgi:DNA-binding NarL/FixJ family response regulator
MKGILSDREREVAILVAEGLKDVEISKELFISRRRVGEIISSIKKKLNITSRVHIGIAAYSLGLTAFQFDFQQEHNIS